MTTSTQERKTILVPIDFSKTSKNALNHAVSMAKVYGNDIAVIFVIEDTILSGIFGMSKEKAELLKSGIQTKLNEWLSELQIPAGMNITTVIKEGRVYKEVVSYASSADCGRIVMGYNGEGKMEKLMGSTTNRIVKHAKLPVVLIKENTNELVNGYKKIILPIDLSPESKQKVVWAVKMAKKFDSTIYVIFEEETEKYINIKVKSTINQVKNLLKEEGVKFVLKELTDEEYPLRFSKDIIQYSNEIDADLIMIMTQQESAISDLVINSLAQEVITKSKDTAVMCINPSKEFKYNFNL